MDKKILGLIPKRYLCPYCGEWHKWESGHSLRWFDSSSFQVALGCENQHPDGKKRRTWMYFNGESCQFKTQPTCGRANFNLDDDIPIEAIEESTKEPRVTFHATFTADSDLNERTSCRECGGKETCLLYKLGCKNKSRQMLIPFGFEFDDNKYFAIVKKEEEATMKNATKEASMKKTATKLWDQLYKHSPEENVRIIKEWGGKYKPTLRWAVPVASVYVAYRILNTEVFKSRIGKLGEECEEKLGFSLDPLKDKKALRQLMTLGGAIALAYGTNKGLNAIFNTEEVTSESVEEGMTKLEKLSNKFQWLMPKAEKLMPVAASVIVLYMMTQKPEFLDKAKHKGKDIAEDLTTRASVYVDLLKAFAADKLNFDLSNEEELQKLKKFAILAAVTGVGLFLYGKNGEEQEEGKQKEGEQEDFMKSLLGIMKKMMPTAFAALGSYLVAKNFLPTKYAEFIDADFEEVEEPGEAKISSESNESDGNNEAEKHEDPETSEE